jgi:hypothetical protein
VSSSVAQATHTKRCLTRIGNLKSAKVSAAPSARTATEIRLSMLSQLTIHLELFASSVEQSERFCTDTRCVNDIDFTYSQLRGVDLFDLSNSSLFNHSLHASFDVRRAYVCPHTVLALIRSSAQKKSTRETKEIAAL